MSTLYIRICNVCPSCILFCVLLDKMANSDVGSRYSVCVCPVGPPHDGRLRRVQVDR